VNTGKTDRFLAQNSNFEILEKIKNRAIFLIYWLVFSIYRSVFDWFLFKIQILNENGLLLGFSGLSVDFFDFS
jgi:hypothetical protein